MIDRTRYIEIQGLLRHAANNAKERPATATAQALIAIATVFLEEAVNHDECVRTEDRDPRGHGHDGATGRYLWPDQSPIGA